MAEKKILIINIPVIHKGFLDFLKKNKNNVSKIFIVNPKLVEKISDLRNDIAAIDYRESKKILISLGFKNISSIGEKNIRKLNGSSVVMINDHVSREIKKFFLKNSQVIWKDVFLRWDKDSISAEHFPGEKISAKKEDKIKIAEAYKEAKKSTDWWRRVGAVLVKGNKVVLRGHNRGVPDDYTSYQVGNIRDFIKAGEKQELSSTIHAEQKIVAEAAQKGISLKGTKLYITHFPCPVCAKLIMFSGIKKCFFVEGASNLDGGKMLKLAGVDLFVVDCSK
ncbi:MAG: deaminase [Candidatus Paceibacterota bacterium]|jgi:dCMP deaminase